MSDTPKVTLAPVDKYAEVLSGTGIRSAEDTILAEGRMGQVDQIADYHTVHPTLDTSGPEHDPAVQADLFAKAAVKAKPSKAEVHDAVKA